MLRFIFNRVTLVFVALTLAVWFGWGYVFPEKVDKNNLGVVTRMDITQRVTISGLVVPHRSAMLKAPYDGYVHKVFVTIGQAVKRGDPIVTVTQTPDGAAESTFPLRAPLSGRVMQILKGEGEDVMKSTGTDGTLVRIDDMSKLYIESDTPEMDFPKLKIGQKAVVKASSIPEKAYEGQIIELFQSAKAQDRWDRARVEFPIRVMILNKDDRLKPGMSVTMDIITAESKNALALRHDFVGKNKDKYFVILPDGSEQEIAIGMRSEDAFEILSGVEEGQSVQQIDFLANAESSTRRPRGGRKR